MDIVLTLHSLVRFAVLIAALVGLVITLVAFVQKRAATASDRTIGSVFLGLYDLQALLGLLIIFLGGLSAAVHPIVMFVGLVVAHGLQARTRRAEGTQALVGRLALYIVPLAIILFGLAVIGRLPA